mgnify:CR=1 FL=1
MNHFKNTYTLIHLSFEIQNYFEIDYFYPQQIYSKLQLFFDFTTNMLDQTKIDPQ